MSRHVLTHYSVDSLPGSSLPSLPWEQSLDVGGGLLLVLLAIVACAWLGKRILRITPSTNGQLSVVSGISLGARDRVVLVSVGKQQVLLGVSPGRIQTLHVLPAPDDANTAVASDEQTGEPEFSGELNRAMSHTTGDNV